LLYLATEHGVYVSFNDGAKWQSLQMNLPDTPIRDLVLRNNDVVLGSHGRGFWIMGDIAPLRDAASMDMSKVKLFKPANPIRGVYNANIQYYLPNEAENVTVEIMDAQGNLINTYVGKKSEGRRSRVATGEGLNDFNWDLRYPGATTFDGMIIWSGRPQRGPLAPLGDYQVKLTVDGVSQSSTFTVEMDPNLEGITKDDLQKQFDLALMIRDKTSAANEAVIQIRNIRAQAQKLKGSNAAGLDAAIDDMLSKMKVIEEDLYQVKNQSGQDPLNFPIKLNNRFASLRRSIESGQARPTDAAYVVFDELSAELKMHLDKLDQVLNSDLKRQPLSGKIDLEKKEK